MRQQGTKKETAASATVTVLPTDTLLCALRVMEAHHLRLLPVVEETGVLLGLVSEAHILQAWGEGPLQPVSEVMAECGFPWAPEEEDELEAVRLLRAAQLLEGRGRASGT
ncbi:CBS domain-containing protein [Hyalangium rubrum]|uniref:CBS domain-containing protein n=1 Tax=Hyalangium rubrum TaxID=3103134 RepID=A0ABU5GXU8_9BACT|nr:CBS domain-containing protein [Hyalangium sp. s54d21]MDY7226026.1 CBS domain-containing protein [Hyalangium sp. s54d21]